MSSSPSTSPPATNERRTKSPEALGVAETPSETGDTAPPTASPKDSAGPSESAPTASTSAPANASEWQAVWSPQYNAYYFFNSTTQETTWTNPLEATAPAASAPAADDKGEGPSTAASEAGAAYTALQAAALAQGIDPALAHLDPSLVDPAGPVGPYAYTAKFNARTGAFTAADGRDPSHLSEFERAKRMSQFYFDVGQWEKDVEKRKAEEAAEEAAGGKKRKRPTKKDLVRRFLPVSRCCADRRCRRGLKSRRSRRRLPRQHGCVHDIVYAYLTCFALSIHIPTVKFQ